MSPRNGLRVAIVGATGMVGSELLDVLRRRRFPISQLLPFSSGRSRKSVRFAGRSIEAPAVSEKLLRTCDVAFFASEDAVSGRLAPALAAAGVWVIDDSARFRLDPKVPLVIPEVNAHVLSASSRLIAGPNCTMTGLAVAGYPLHRRAGALALRIASYQAVSGAGKTALAEFYAQNQRLSRGLGGGGRSRVLRELPSAALPRTIAFNVIPQVGQFDASGSSTEEVKVAAELRKVWGAPSLRVSVTAVRVPVIRGHALSAWISFENPLSPPASRRLLARAPGVKLSRSGDYPTPLSVGGKDPVCAGRVRSGVDSREICLWIVSDNLLKGAALNSAQIAELLLRRGWLRSRGK